MPSGVTEPNDHEGVPAHQCDRCGKVQMVNRVHMKSSDTPLCAIRDDMRHVGCGGRPGRTELITGVEAATSRPVVGAVTLCRCIHTATPQRLDHASIT